MGLAQVKDRFLNKVEKTNNCWNWKAYIRHDGRGEFSFNSKAEKAHRISHLLFKGNIPEGLHVLHKCDNPKCVKPSHLFLGTHADNMRDCKAKGRHFLSTKTHCSNGHKFTEKNTRYRKRPDQKYISRVCRVCESRTFKEARYGKR